MPPFVAGSRPECIHAANCSFEGGVHPRETSVLRRRRLGRGEGPRAESRRQGPARRWSAPVGSRRRAATTRGQTTTASSRTARSSDAPRKRLIEDRERRETTRRRGELARAEAASATKRPQMVPGLNELSCSWGAAFGGRPRSAPDARCLSTRSALRHDRPQMAFHGGSGGGRYRRFPLARSSRGELLLRRRRARVHRLL